MPRPLRFIAPGALVEVTNRTFQGRLLLRPSPLFNEVLLGVLGWAQSLTGMAIHAVVVLSNHYHLLCSPRDAVQLAKFECLFNSRLAKEVVRLHKWRDKVWRKRYNPISVSHEPAAQIGRLLYILSHGCKEGFVLSPREWPGVNCIDAWLLGKPLRGTLFNRTLEYEANRKGLEYGIRDFSTPQTVELTPLPCWQDLALEDIRSRIRDLVHQVEQEALQRRVETGRPCKGASWVLAQDPHAFPLFSERSPAPAVHAATRNVRKAMRNAYRAFVAAYRSAAERLRKGDVAVEFPPGCFPPPLPFVRGSPLVAAT